MKFKVLVFVVVGMSLSLGAWAQSIGICLDDNGFVVPCPPTTPEKVTMHFSAGTLPTKVGVPADVYIVGESEVTGTGYFLIRANKQVQCRTENDYTTTPIRHCVVTITSPGTYTFDAEPYSGNFNAPYPVTVDVTQ